MNEAIIIYGSVPAIFAIAVIIYINYQEKKQKNKETQH